MDLIIYISKIETSAFSGEISTQSGKSLRGSLF